jgi:hypothetical protein
MGQRLPNQGQCVALRASQMGGQFIDEHVEQRAARGGRRCVTVGDRGDPFARAQPRLKPLPGEKSMPFDQHVRGVHEGLAKPAILSNPAVASRRWGWVSARSAESPQVERR